VFRLYSDKQYTTAELDLAVKLVCMLKVCVHGLIIFNLRLMRLFMG